MLMGVIITIVLFAISYKLATEFLATDSHPNTIIMTTICIAICILGVVAFSYTYLDMVYDLIR